VLNFLYILWFSRYLAAWFYFYYYLKWFYFLQISLAIVFSPCLYILYYSTRNKKSSFQNVLAESYRNVLVIKNVLALIRNFFLFSIPVTSNIFLIIVSYGHKKQLYYFVWWVAEKLSHKILSDIVYFYDLQLIPNLSHSNVTLDVTDDGRRL
jgi:hypothetical protein